MLRNQVFFLLKTLNVKEVREMKKFLKSPFFNQRKDVTIVFDFLMGKIQKGKAIPAKDRIFSKVYPDKKFDAQVFRQLMSWLQQLVEKYLAYQVMMKDELSVKLKLATVFRERELPRHNQKIIKSVESQLEKTKYRNADFYQHSFALEQEKYLSASIKRMTARNFHSLSEDLNIAFIIQKLQQACRLVAHQAVYNFDLELGLLPEVLEYIQKNRLENNPTIAAYQYCYFALIYPERIDYFSKFKKILFENTEKFPAPELRDLYLLAINFCIRRLNKGYREFAQEGLNLYQKGIEIKVLFINGILSRFTFQNIVAMGLKVKELDWVEQFILSYHQSLEIGYQESTYALNMALLEYNRKNLDAVLPLLQRADYKDLLMNLSAKTLAAKVYYELDEDLLLDAHLHTMQIYIRRKKVIGYHRENYLNFIRYLKKMVAARNSLKPEIESILNAVQKEKVLTQKEWFLEKLMASLPLPE